MARKPEKGSEEQEESSEEVPEIEPPEGEPLVVPRVVSNEDMLNAIYDNTQRILTLVSTKEK